MAEPTEERLQTPAPIAHVSINHCRCTSERRRRAVGGNEWMVAEDGCEILHLASIRREKAHRPPLPAARARGRRGAAGRLGDGAAAGARAFGDELLEAGGDLAPLDGVAGEVALWNPLQDAVTETA